MPPVAEHHVADDQQAPFVADHFEREIDRAAGALCVGHVTRSLPPCGGGLGRGVSHKHCTRETPAPDPGERASLVSIPQGGGENTAKFIVGRASSKNHLQYRITYLRIQP